MYVNIRRVFSKKYCWFTFVFVDWSFASGARTDSCPVSLISPDLIVLSYAHSIFSLPALFICKSEEFWRAIHFIFYNFPSRFKPFQSNLTKQFLVAFNFTVVFFTLLHVGLRFFDNVIRRKLQHSQTLIP